MTKHQQASKFVSQKRVGHISRFFFTKILGRNKEVDVLRVLQREFQSDAPIRGFKKRPVKWGSKKGFRCSQVKPLLILSLAGEGLYP